MGKIWWKGSALLSPVPVVMVSCGSMDKPNIITVAWTGIVCTNPPKTYISLRPSRYSYALIEQSREFAINLVPASLAKKADYCGTYTGAKADKFSKCAFTPIKAKELSCPLIAESPVSLECRVTDIILLGSHNMFLADIVSVCAEEEMLDEGGKLRLETAKLCAYSHGEYFELGRKIGKIGFSTDKPNKKRL